MSLFSLQKKKSRAKFNINKTWFLINIQPYLSSQMLGFIKGYQLLTTYVVKTLKTGIFCI